MPSKKLLSKPCNCDKNSFQWREFKLQEDLGVTKKIIVYEALICKNHGSQWGIKRNEKIVETCISIPNKVNLNEIAITFFRSIFSSLWKGKINIQSWNKKVLSRFHTTTPDKITNSFLQKGLIVKETIPLRTTLKKKHFIQLTPFGREQIKNIIGFVSSEDQVVLAKEKIHRTLNILGNAILNPSQKILRELLNAQLQKIEKDIPGWQLEDDSLIIPRNSAKNPPKYLFITYGLCTWLKIYRDNLTLRGISARAFQETKFSLDCEPSKVLGNYSRDLNSILKKFSGKDCVDLGLILALDSFTFSGELILRMQDGRNIVINGLSISFSNLSYGNIKSIKLTVKKVLFIENFAVFAQMVLDNWGVTNNTLLIFIKGMGISGHFKKTILNKIFTNNPDIKYFVWLDYDLGGCNIYREIVNNLAADNVKIIKIPSKLSVAFRNIPDNQVDSIKAFCNSKNFELKNFATFILNNGRVEQEYLLEWYNEILNYNFQEYL